MTFKVPSVLSNLNNSNLENGKLTILTDTTYSNTNDYKNGNFKYMITSNNVTNSNHANH